MLIGEDNALSQFPLQAGSSVECFADNYHCFPLHSISATLERKIIELFTVRFPVGLQSSDAHHKP